MSTANLTIEPILAKAIKPRPHFDELHEETKEALASYYGGRKLYDYIYPFSRQENPEKADYRRYQTRKHYRNYPQEIARKYAEGVFRTDSITRVYNDESFDDYLKNSYSAWFKKDLAPFSLLLPEMWVIISKPETEIEPTTKADEQELGIYPYPSIIYPQHIHNFKLDLEGCVEWVSIKQGDLLKVYTEDNIYIVNDKGELQGPPMPHGWPECPVVRIAWQENTSCMEAPFIGHAFLKTVIDLSIANLQYTSMLVEMGYFHLSYKLIMGEETARVATQTGIGNQTAIVETDQEKGTTRYLALPSVEMDKLVDIVYNKNPDAIYEAARLTNRTGMIALSGAAKAMDMIPEMAALTEVAEFWRSVDTRILELMAMGQFGAQYESKQKEAKIQYPVSFDVRNAQQVMAELTQLTDAAANSELPFSPTFLKETVKRAQRTIMPDADAELLKTFDDEVDKLAEEKQNAEEEPTPVATQLEAPQAEPMMDQKAMPKQKGKNTKMPMKMMEE